MHSMIIKCVSNAMFSLLITYLEEFYVKMFLVSFTRNTDADTYVYKLSKYGSGLKIVSAKSGTILYFVKTNPSKEAKYLAVL